jgi:hypothetical protein
MTVRFLPWLLVLLVFSATAADVVIDGESYRYVGDINIDQNTFDITTNVGDLVCTPGAVPPFGGTLKFVLDGYEYLADEFRFTPSLGVLNAPLMTNCDSDSGVLTSGNYIVVLNGAVGIGTNINLVYLPGRDTVTMTSGLGDVVCDNGLFVGDLDVIFSDRFEP